MAADPMATHALPISIESLFHGRVVEWERLEYKKGWNPEAVLHTMCAFANDFHNLGGGFIIVGVEEENGRPKLPPVGVDPESLDAIQKEIVEIGYKAIQPSYHPRSIMAKFQGANVLVIWVTAGAERPYRAKAKLAKGESEWCSYIRRQSSTVIAKNQDLKELIGLAAVVPFDDQISRSGTIDDLSKPLMVQYLRDVESDLVKLADELSVERLGRQMNVVGGPTESPAPKNIGLMMFNDNPEFFFPVTQIDVVYFPDDPGGDIFEEKEFKGPLPSIIRDSLRHIQRNYLIETVIKHEDRPEATRIWNFPYRAIEEAVANAIYHRSYEIREPVEVQITPEELCVLNFPGPDRSIRMRDFDRGRALSRRYRNRRIGEYLKELELTEGRSTGIAKIMNAVERNGSPVPVFETDEDRSYFLVRFPVHTQAGTLRGVAHSLLRSDAKEGRRSRAKCTSKAAYTEFPSSVAPETMEKYRISTRAYPRVAKLLLAMTGEMGRAQLQQALELSDRKSFRREYLQPALECGLVEMTLPEKPSSPVQGYRLSVRGKRFIREIRLQQFK